ncbi:MAG: tetratricopeptide repeat protein [Acidobacteria bacterium]|nr:tetratricopeptide repeat protein [Acidobacteriota bacterium]
MNDRLAEAFALHGRGQTYDRLGDQTKALDSYQQSLAIFQSFGNQGWGRLFDNLAPLYMIMGGKPAALDYLAHALPLVRALHNYRLEAILLTGIGKTYQDLNDLQPALEHYHQALLRYRRLGNRSEEAITLTEIADADLSLAEREKAIAYLQQALPIARAVGDRSLEATMLFGIGYVYNLLDERQKALDYYEQALPIFRAVNDGKDFGKRSRRCFESDVACACSGKARRKTLVDCCRRCVAIHTVCRAPGTRRQSAISSQPSAVSS